MRFGYRKDMLRKIRRSKYIAGRAKKSLNLLRVKLFVLA